MAFNNLILGYHMFLCVIISISIASIFSNEELGNIIFIIALVISFVIMLVIELLITLERRNRWSKS